MMPPLLRYAAFSADAARAAAFDADISRADDADA